MKAVVAVGLGCGEVLLAPTTIASQTEIPRPFRKAQPFPPPLRRGIEGGAAKRVRKGCPFKVRANESFYPADVFPLRRAEEATGLARGANRAMTGAVLSERFPEGRRSGDVCGAGLKVNYKQPIARDPKHAAMLRQTIRQAESSPKGRIKRAQTSSLPLCVAKGGRVERSERQGVHTLHRRNTPKQPTPNPPNPKNPSSDKNDKPYPNCRNRGSNRSRSQSPKKFSDITVRKRAVPGITEVHHAVCK